MNRVGAVVIGRNEGDRLRLCLESMLRSGIPHIVYVDSDSHDGSVALAQSLGVTALELDMSKKFTAARARNAGLWELLRLVPEVEFVQFVDGDCEVVPGWLERALEAFEKGERLAAVCGRRRERNPEFSLYNRLCDLEWDTPVGDATACGGDAMFSVQALRDVEGYRESLIAGEEPEMCYRMRQLGYRVCRLDAEMTLHDAAISTPSQWFKRTKRSGHAFAEHAALHGHEDERLGVKQTLSNLFWGAALPVALGATALTVGPVVATVGGALCYRHLYKKSLRYEVSRPGGARNLQEARLVAAGCVAGKVPEALGAAEYWVNRLRGKQSKLMEYK